MRKRSKQHYELSVQEYGPSLGYRIPHWTVHIVGLGVWVDSETKVDALDKAAAVVGGRVVWEPPAWRIEVV